MLMKQNELELRTGELRARRARKIQQARRACVRGTLLLQLVSAQQNCEARVTARGNTSVLPQFSHLVIRLIRLLAPEGGVCAAQAEPCKCTDTIESLKKSHEIESLIKNVRTYVHQHCPSSLHPHYTSSYFSLHHTAIESKNTHFNDTYRSTCLLLPAIRMHIDSFSSRGTDNYQLFSHKTCYI